MQHLKLFLIASLFTFTAAYSMDDNIPQPYQGYANGRAADYFAHQEKKTFLKSLGKASENVAKEIAVGVGTNIILDFYLMLKYATARLIWGKPIEETIKEINLESQSQQLRQQALQLQQKELEAENNHFFNYVTMMKFLINSASSEQEKEDRKKSLSEITQSFISKKENKVLGEPSKKLEQPVFPGEKKVLISPYLTGFIVDPSASAQQNLLHSEQAAQAATQKFKQDVP